jgi:signal transduction histidine kinase
VRASGPESDNYKVAVQDNGPGIPDEIKGEIFDRMKRGPGNTKGSGLGLFIVKMLVEMYHGHVWIEDASNGNDGHKGCKFVVMLPAAR